MKSFGIQHLTLRLFTAIALAGLSLSSSVSADQEKPGMLARVRRAPGILPGDPSEMPNGDQADLYYELLETDPRNTSFRKEWESRSSN